MLVIFKSHHPVTSAISACISLSGRDCPFGSSDPFPGIKKRKKNAMIVSRLQCDRNFTFVSHLWWNGGYFKKWYFGCVVYCKRPMIQLHVSFIVIYLPLLRTVSQDFIGLCKVFIFINQVQYILYWQCFVIFNESNVLWGPHFQMCSTMRTEFHRW